MYICGLFRFKSVLKKQSEIRSVSTVFTKEHRAHKKIDFLRFFVFLIDLRVFFIDLDLSNSKLDTWSNG
jgi:hypothetical protein